MAANAPQLDADCTCSVCCDIFNDPVVLLCGHSFCKHCIREWWRQSALQTCPVCTEVFPVAEPPRNHALRHLSDALRQERSRRGASEDTCALHGEAFKLYCEEDQELICVVCRDSQKHRRHSCVPISEAAETNKNQLKLALLHLKSKKASFTEEKLKCDKMASHIKLQAQQTEKTIREEFQKFYQFLRAEEAARVDAVRKEAISKSSSMNIRITNLTAEIDSLTDKIKTVEKEIRATDVSFMLNVKSTLERSQCNLPDPQTPSGALIDEAKHLSNLMFTVWKKMMDLIQYSPVTLDPNTCSSLLAIKDHMTRATKASKWTLPGNPERLPDSYVYGRQGISSGKHSWDVELEEGDYWTVGVSLKTKHADPKKETWGIYVCACHVWLHELTPEDDSDVVSKEVFPEKVRVQLDYDKGVLSFFDLDRNTPIHTIIHKFTETVYPSFAGNVKILPS